MIFFFFLVCLFWNVSIMFSKTYMSLVWGVADTLEFCQNSTVLWNQCYQNCYEDNGCIMASWNNSFCSLCAANTVTNICQRGYFNGSKIAIKFNLTSDICTASFLNPVNISGAVINKNNIYLSYTYDIVGTSNGWQIVSTGGTTTRKTTTTTRTTTPKPQCDAGWKYFKRTNCGWCIQVFQDNTSSWTTAQSKCEALGGYMTGMENMDEQFYIANEGNPFIISRYANSLWVDGTRKTTCNTPTTVKKCPKTFAAFDFQDPCASGTAGYVSPAPGAMPDGVVQDGVVQSYLNLIITPNNVYATTDDNLNNGNFYVIGYACGKYSNF